MKCLLSIRRLNELEKETNKDAHEHHFWRGYHAAVIDMKLDKKKNRVGGKNK